MKRCVPSQRNVPMKKYTDKKSEIKISVKEKRQGQKMCRRRDAWTQKYVNENRRYENMHR